MQDQEQLSQEDPQEQWMEYMRGYSWRRIDLVIESHWRVVETNRRRTASSGSTRVSQISR